MKKVSVFAKGFRYILASGMICTSVLLSGCENFLNGAELKKELELASADSKEIQVLIRNNAYGILTQEGSNSIKQGKPFKLNLTLSSDYVLNEWLAYYSDQNPDEIESLMNSEEESDKAALAAMNLPDVSFYNAFSDGNSQSTEVKVNSIPSGKTVYISPLCTRRPYVESFSCDGETVSIKNCFSIKFSEEMELHYQNGDIWRIYPKNGTWTTLGSSPYYYDSTHGQYFLDPDDIKIVIKDYKDAQYEQDATYFFFVEQNGGTLAFKPSFMLANNYITYLMEYGCFFVSKDDLNNAVAEGKIEITYDQGLPTIKSKNNLSDMNDLEGFHSTIDNTAFDVQNGLCSRYIEIRINKNLKSKKGVSLNSDYQYGFIQNKTVDTVAPSFVKAQFFLPDLNFVYTYDLYNTREILYDNSVYVKSDIYNESSSSLTFDKFCGQYLRYGSYTKALPYGCRYGLSNYDTGTVGTWAYFPKRIKDRILFYGLMADGIAEDEPPLSDANVQRIRYDLYRISDSQGNKRTSYASPQTEKWNYKPESTYSAEAHYYHEDEYQAAALKRMDENPYVKSLSSLVNNNGGFVIDFNFGNDTLYPDGLYCLEICGQDYGKPLYSQYDYETDPYGDAGNAGYELTSTDAYKTSNVTSSSSDGYIWKKHNAQLWFIKDTLPPATTAADFELPVRHWYNAANIKTLAVPVDGEGGHAVFNNSNYTWDSSRKIVDAGNSNFNSAFTDRICKIELFDKPNGLEEGWFETYVEDYVFEDIYGSGNWGAESLTEGEHNIYAYVKDDVNNVGELITLENAFGYDNTAPAAKAYESKPYDFPNTTRMYLYATVDETVSGIKQIKYDIDYEAADIKAVYVKKSEWVSASYTVDAETKTITLAEPAITGTVGVLFGGCTSDNTHSASLIFIDAAENESESVLYTIE